MTERSAARAWLTAGRHRANCVSLLLSLILVERARPSSLLRSATHIQEPVWPATRGRATQASLPASADTSDVTTSGIYLKHKGGFVQACRRSVITHTRHEKQRALQRLPQDAAAQRQWPDNTEQDGPARFQRASVVITRRPGTPRRWQPCLTLQSCRGLAVTLLWVSEASCRSLLAGLGLVFLDSGRVPFEDGYCGARRGQRLGKRFEADLWSHRLSHLYRSTNWNDPGTMVV